MILDKENSIMTVSVPGDGFKNLDRGDASTDQHIHWEQSFTEKPDMFGSEPSLPARYAAGIFRENEVSRVLELGGGQGRDTIFFAREGFYVTTLDYSEKGVIDIKKKAEESGASSRVRTFVQDVRKPLPFDKDCFDACFSHMLFCMDLKIAELISLSAEVRRVLRPGGYHVFTVRHTGDPHYRKGVHKGEDIYQTGGFAVHFFSREKVGLLTDGFSMEDLEEFEEGGLPRRLFRVTLRKVQHAG